MTIAYPAAVLWDMDGTIVDTEPYWIEAETALVESFGGTWTMDDAMQLVGSGLWESAEILRAAGVDMAPDDLVTYLTDKVRALLRERGAPFRPGALELITELGEHGVRGAIVTMSTHPMAAQIAELLPSGSIELLVTGDAVERPKPHPDPYLQAARLLGVDIADCVAIEDSPTGLRAAISSGATAIGVPHALPIEAAPGFTRLDTLAGFTVAELAAIHFQRTTNGPTA